MTGPSLDHLRSGLLDDLALKGLDWCNAWAGAVDGWLADLFASAAAGRKGLALLAVGGYGRSTLAPRSDLDLLLVHDSHKRVGEVAEALWYPVWDSGMRLDHSVRTVREVRSAMDSDIKVAIGLLDARLVAGEADLAAAVRERVLAMWATRGDRWLRDLAAITKARHERFGDLAFLLEPDLKEARGGLRDLDLLRSLGKVTPVLSALDGDGRLRRAAEVLTSARVELQRPAKSPSNVLLLQDQDTVAEALGLDGADSLMAAVAGAARSAAWASDDGWRRIESSLAGPKGRGGGGDVVIEPGVAVRDGEISLAPGADPSADPSLALRVAAASAERDLPIARATLDRLGGASAPAGTWPPDALQALLRILGSGRPAIAAVEALDQGGVWTRYLPEWSAVRNRPQRNAYHRYTVDRHLLETAAAAAPLQSAVRRPDLLLLAALLHDIGKGRGGDHTEVGVSLVEKLGSRLGLAPADVSTLASLVRHHLLLPDAATRRDLDDPATARAVAAAVADAGTLELLAALTEADGQATGPAAWGRWKAVLVSRLADQVAGILAGYQPPASRPAALSAEERSMLASRRLTVAADGGRLSVAAPDQTGLLAVVAGVLTLAGVNVRSATTASDEASAMALLRFEVTPAFDRLPDWAQVRARLEAALGGRLDVDALLVERESRYSRFRATTAAHTPGVAVLFDNDSTPASTIVEVRAPDRGPVLYRVSRALASCGVYITCALVTTLGAEAVDVFYVQRAGGGRVVEPAALEGLRAAVTAALTTASGAR